MRGWRQRDHPYLAVFLMNVCIGAGVMVGVFGIIGLTEMAQAIW